MDRETDRWAPNHCLTTFGDGCS